MAKSKLVKANEKIAETVVGGYKKVETTVVDGYRKIEDAFVERYLTHEGESAADAKARLRAEKEVRKHETGYVTIPVDGYAKQVQTNIMEHAGQAGKQADI